MDLSKVFNNIKTNIKGVVAHIPGTTGITSSNPSTSPSNNNIVAQPQSTPTPSNMRAQGETYQQWGTRWAGQTNASVTALPPCMQVVYRQLKMEMQQDIKGQQILHQNFQTQLQNEENNLANQQIIVNKENDNLLAEQNKKDDLLKNIQDDKNQIQDLKNGPQTLKEKANVVIGCLILLGLTVYLFIFYSSASYSAFFKNFDANVTLQASIFDPQSIPNSFHSGFASGLFVLLLPFIFLALGYVAHQFSSKEKGLGIYLKTAALYFITFIFDSLLAYQIGKKIYDVWVTTQLNSQPPYSLSYAFESGDFWMVIFCGFIAYAIWGLLFGFTMDSYDNMKFHTAEINNLMEDINNINTVKIPAADNLINKAQTTLNGEKTKSNNIQNSINQLQIVLNSPVIYDDTVIYRELSNFFTGWVGYMKLVNQPQIALDSAQTIYDNQLNTIKSNLAQSSVISINSQSTNSNVSSQPVICTAVSSKKSN